MERRISAFWRWSKKSGGMKRGGYVLGRMLIHDPDTKSAWLQAGGATVQVTYEQLRPTYGLESWTPSAKDVKALKNAGKTLVDGLWQDQRGPGPPQEEPMEPDVTMPDAQVDDTLDIPTG